MKQAKALSVAEAESILAVLITGWEGMSSYGASEAESCRISHHVRRIEFRQILRDAEIAYAISPVVRKHRLSAEETDGVVRGDCPPSRRKRRPDHASFGR